MVTLGIDLGDIRTAPDMASVLADQATPGAGRRPTRDARFA
jgi:hypothetical protein